MRPPTRRAVHVGAGLALLSAVSLLLAGCSSSSASTPTESVSTTTSSTSSGGGGVAAATTAVAEAAKEPAFTLKATPFDIKGVAGKTIVTIPSSSQIPYVVEIDKEMQAQAEKYGATWVEYTNQGSPTQWAAGVDQAVNQKADLIILSQGVNPELLIAPLTRAKSAGIPVLVSHAYQNGKGPAAAAAALVTAQVTAPFEEAARLEVDWAVADSGGAANILVITSAEVPPSNGITDAMQAEVAASCPDCKIKIVNVPLTDWATKIASSVQSALAADPGINYVLPIYDSMSIYAQAGIKSGGGIGKVKIGSFNGTAAILSLIQEGDVMAMDVGENITWLAWATVDQAGRLLTGTTPVENGDEKTPLRIFTDQNVAEAGTPPVSGKGFGDAYVAGYNSLWGVTS